MFRYDRRRLRANPFNLRTPGVRHAIECLESRLLLSAGSTGNPLPLVGDPTLAAIDDVVLFSGSPLHIPLDGFDSGGPLSFSVVSSDPNVETFVLEGNRSLRISVSGFGDMVIELFDGRARRATDRIAELAEQGFYDGVTFYNVLSDFLILGGDPTGTGNGGSELANIDDAFHVELQHNRAGVLSMASREDDTNNSRFLITDRPARELDYDQTVFGQLVEGDSVREAIQNTPVDAEGRPIEDVVMETVEVFMDQENAILMLKAPEGYSGQADISVTARDEDGNVVNQQFHVTVEPDTVNSNPFLEQMPVLHTPVDTPITFTPPARDVEGDVPFLLAGVIVDPTHDIEIDNQAHTFTVIPLNGFVGTLDVLVGVAPGPNLHVDSQPLSVVVFDAPTGLALPPELDTGADDSDDVTRLNNGAGAALEFRVDGVSVGATVTLLDGDTTIGQAVATGTTLTIPLDTSIILTDGLHTITAVQDFGGERSRKSPAVELSVDTTVPAITTTPVVTALVGLSYEYDVDTDEELNDGVIYQLLTSPAGLTVDPATGQIAWTPGFEQVGFHDVVIRVDDLAGNMAQQNFSVEAVNARPVLAGLDDLLIDEGDVVHVVAAATDANLPGDKLIYSLVGDVPAGLQFDAATGEINWITGEDDGPGVYGLTVRVTDLGGLSTEEGFSITVNEINDAPAIDAVGDQVVFLGQTLSLQIVATDADIPQQILAYSLDSNAEEATIDAATGLITWIPSGAEANKTFEMTVHVTDGQVESTAAFRVFVQNTDLPPSLESIADAEIDEHNLFTFTATAQDANLPGDELKFSLDGDAPSGASIEQNTGTFQWMPDEVDGPGIFPITVRVRDITGLEDVTTFTLTVREVNQPPSLALIDDVTIDEGDELSLAADATDSDLPVNGLVFSLDSAPAGAQIDPDTGDITWLTNESDGPDTFDFTVRVSDGISDATQTFSVEVVEINTAPELMAVPGQSVAEGETLSFTVVATDADIPANSLTYSLGTGAPSGANIDPLTGMFAWTTTEANGPGDFSISVRVTDEGGLEDVITVSVSVSEVNSAPVLDLVEDATVAEGRTLNIQLTATDVDVPANGLTFSLDAGAPPSVDLDATTGALTWIPGEADGPGAVLLSVRVTDDQGSSDVQEFTITVTEEDSPPVLDPIGDQFTDLGVLVSFIATATDPDLPVNELTFTLDPGAPAGAEIDPATGQFFWTPSGENAIGVFGLTIRVADSTGLEDSTTIQITVADPNDQPGPGLPHQQIIDRVFEDLLGRAADPASLAFYGDRFTDGRLNSNTMAQTVQRSEEYRIRAIEALYDELLGRASDPTGMRAHLGFLSDGGSMDGLKATFMASDEYYEKRGFDTDSGFLAAIYEDTLDRRIDPAGQQNFIAFLNSRSNSSSAFQSRRNAALALMSSSEAKQATVQQYYFRFLGRTGEASGVEFHMRLLAAGIPDMVVMAGFFGSEEYQSERET